MDITTWVQQEAEAAVRRSRTNRPAALRRKLGRIALVRFAMSNRHKAERKASPFTETLLADLENRLLWARARVGRELASLAADTLAVDPQRSDQSSERAADEYAQSVNVSLLQQDADALWQIEEALERIEGRGATAYGLCQHCAGEPQHLCASCPWIPEERLLAVPWAVHCAAVQERLDRHELAPATQGEENLRRSAPARSIVPSNKASLG